jgi:DNA-binding HxlR family transcriptional regulator
VAARDYGQYCGVTRALELVGERWALLIVRDLLVGPRRYGELAAGLPRIPSNILAARLKELQAAGVIRRLPRSRVVVYELTPYGRELEPVVLALGAWGFKAMGEPREEQVITPDAMTIALRTAFRPQVAAALPATAYGARLGPAELLVRVDGARLEVTRGEGPVDLAFAAGPGIRRLISGELAPDRAIATGVVEVLRGPGALLDRFASTFHLAARPGRARPPTVGR